MQTTAFTPDQIERWKLRASAFSALAERYRSDAALRSRIDGGDVEDALSDLGLVPPPGIEVRIAANTADTFHVVMPPDPNTELSDEMLSAVAGAVAGGKSAGCAACSPGGGTAGTAWGGVGPELNDPDPGMW